jgi:putative DNA primase/helicase
MSAKTTMQSLDSTEPIKVARWLLSSRFRTPQGRIGLWVWRGSILEWFGGQWLVRSRDWLESAVWLALEDATYTVQTTTGTVRKRFAPTPMKVDGVIRALKQVALLRYEHLPAWASDDETGIDPLRTMSFLDVIVDVKTLNVMPRDERWIQPHVLPVYLSDQDVGCPTWLRCLDEWGNGCDQWKTLVQRMFGYCLTAHSLYAKWFLLHGKVRGGKGTMTTVLRKLLNKAYMGTSLEDLARPFGLLGLESAKVLSIGEVAEIRGTEAETACRVLKQIVGRDPLVIDVKYEHAIRDVISNAIPIMQANEIPKLPNKGMGLSSKMVPIPFNVSFLGREDHRLIEKLEAELPAIASWALKGAYELEQEKDPSKRFPLTKDGLSILEDYRIANNPVDDFLEEHFERAPNGFVASSVIGSRWKDWADANGARQMSFRVLMQHLKEHSSWELEKGRMGSGGPRGLKGLRIKKSQSEPLGSLGSSLLEGFE